MKVGGKAHLVCPPELAYGDEGHPPQMPGGATLSLMSSCWTSCRPRLRRPRLPNPAKKK